MCVCGLASSTYRKWGFAVLCGIGSAAGEHGKWSKGEPFKIDDDFPSPIQFHTRAVGHSSVTTFTYTENNIITRTVILLIQFETWLIFNWKGQKITNCHWLLLCNQLINRLTLSASIIKCLINTPGQVRCTTESKCYMPNNLTVTEDSERFINILF